VKNFLFVSALFLLVAVSAHTQGLKTIFRDDFDSDTKQWVTGESPGASAAIGGGVYKIDRRSQYGYWLLPAPSVFVDFNINYDIEIRARWLTGTTTNGYGIGFGGANERNVNVVAMASNGQFSAFRFVNGSFQSFMSWTPSAEVKAGSEWNTLTLQKRGTAINIIINGTTASSIVAPEMSGRSFGILVSQQMSLEIDYFEIRQNLAPINLAKDHPINVERENLGPGINSIGGDLSPVISADGKMLIIGRYPFNGNIGDPRKEDIWFSLLKDEQTWGPMQNMGRPLNNEGSNFLISITPDLNTVLVGNTYYPDGSPRSAGVSISHRTADGWEVPAPVNIRDYYNLDRFSEMCLDPSGLVLVMAVMRNDSRGEKDLYVCFKQPDGSFTVPLNMGDINTWGNELSPFVAADGKTMYFATDGRYGYGGVDIWMSRRLDDTWTKWSEPENLGPVINTPKWDAYFTISAKGDYAYLSASNNTDGSADIYRVKLTEGVRPKPVVLVKGHVFDAKTKQPIAALVEYESLTMNKKVGEARSAPRDGAYGIALPSGDLYGFRAEVSGYYPVSDQLDTRSLSTYQEIERDLYLVPLKVNETILLNNLFFDFAQSVLRSESIAELDRLAQLLQSKQTMTIELSGHTDNVGTNTDNVHLSQERVNSVKEYLITKGIKPNRLIAKGYGEKKPIAPNTTEEGRQKNRRVEFKILNI
jgi:outer membrane protein OmpA-like peptidoglycan-associated protein